METNIKPTVEKIDKKTLAVIKTVKEIAVKTKQIIKK